MKLFERTVKLTMILIFISTMLSTYNSKAINTGLNIIPSTPVKAGVLLYSFDEAYLALLKSNLEAIQKENQDKIEFTFFDGKANAAIQNQIIDDLVNDNFNFIVLNIFEKNESALEHIINRASQKNIPIVLFLSSLPKSDAIINNKSVAIIYVDMADLAATEGNIIVDAWNADKKAIDKNNDNVLEYIMLQGRSDSAVSDALTKYSVEAINKAGIQTKALATAITNWDKEVAKEAISSLFLSYGPTMEAIIANNDTMAIGAVEALQKYGFNKGNKSKTIPVVGVGALPEAKELIKNGFMLGSVLGDPYALAKAIYTVGMNLASGKSAIEGTGYKLGPSGVIYPKQFQKYTIETIPKTS